MVKNARIIIEVYKENLPENLFANFGAIEYAIKNINIYPIKGNKIHRKKFMKII